MNLMRTKTNNLKSCNEDPVLIIALDKVEPINIDNLRGNFKLLEEPVENLNIEKDVINEETNFFMATVKFDNHIINIVALNKKIPDMVLKQTVSCSYWSKEEKVEIENHNSHILCYYSGDSKDPVEKYIALYKVVAAFKDYGIKGIINEEGWTSQPGRLIDTLINKENLDEYRKVIPLMIWTNYIKLPTEQGLLVFSKGNHFFGVPEFAYLGKDKDFKMIVEIFNNIFYYLREFDIDIIDGEQISIEDKYIITFRKTVEFKEYLNSPLGTFLIELKDKV